MSNDAGIRQPVVRKACFSLAHVPGMVYSGSKPRREIDLEGPTLQRTISEHLRSFPAAVAYPPHQVMIGNLSPEILHTIPRPWHKHPMENMPVQGPAGYILDAANFYSWLIQGDCANLVGLRKILPPVLEEAIAGKGNMAKIQQLDEESLQKAITQGAEPLYLDGQECIGVVHPDHDQDEALTGPVLLENASAKVLGALALQYLLQDDTGPTVNHLLGCGEEAVGDRYQRGGGNLAKAMGEMAGVKRAGASDVKSFCAGPVHAMILGASLIASGLHNRVIVVGGGSVPKLGMKFRGHLQAGYPILEDILAGVAIDMTVDDGISPLLRLDCAAFHGLGRGSAAHHMSEALSLEPLYAVGMRLQDVDRYAVELHNPDITEPAGSGNVPVTNYRILAAMAAMKKEISREDMDAFIADRGLPGFSPTQGHIASAIPYLPHAISGLKEGNMHRVQFVAKASLFLGRMTSISDGASLILERNPHFSLQPTGK